MLVRLLVITNIKKYKIKKQRGRELKMKKELELMESRELRNELIDRTEVLEKVRELILLPNTEIATIEQVAGYYKVKLDTLQRYVTRNNKELEDNGYRKYKQNEIVSMFERNGHGVQIVSERTYKEVVFSNGEKIKINNTGLRLFNKRAILNIGMLLEGSKVAKQVRTYLLDSEEKLEEDKKIELIDELDEETKAIIGIVNAKDKESMAIALNEYRQLKDGKIHKLEVENEVLVDGILRWDKRKAINKMARLLGANKFGSSRFGFMQSWELISNELLYKYSINVNSRKLKSKLKRPTIFDVLNPDDELDKLLKTTLALCKKNSIDTSNILIA